jgi:hypothetical protein
MQRGLGVLVSNTTTQRRSLQHLIGPYVVGGVALWIAVVGLAAAQWREKLLLFLGCAD